MFELNDIVRLKYYCNKYTFYKVTDIDDIFIQAKNLNDKNSEMNAYFNEDEIEKVTLGVLLNYCKETNKRLILRWIYSDTRKKLEKIIKSLERDYKDFNSLQDHRLDYIFYFGNLTGKEYQELSTIDVFELDIDIDNAYADTLREETKVQIKEERIKARAEQFKIDVKLGDYIRYKDKVYYVVMVKDDFLYLIEQVFTTDPSVTLLTITFKDLAEYQDSLEVHLEDYIKDYSEDIKMDTTTARIVDVKLDGNSLKNVGPTEVDLDTYCINDKCSTCKNEEYLTRDEVKEMIEERFNKINNNRENKEMNETKSMNTFEDIINMVYEDLKKRNQNPETNQSSNVEGKPLPNLYEKYGDLFEGADGKELLLMWKKAFSSI